MKQWHAFLKELDEDLGKNTVDQWLRTLEIEKFDARNLYLKTEDPFQALWFEEHIRPKIKRAFENRLRVHIASPKKEKLKKIRDEPKPASIEYLPDRIDPSFCFENWIDAQTFTTKASKELKIGEINPLFIHGPAGSGKTHLLGAIAQKHKNSYYIHSDHFMRHMVRAIRSSSMNTFRESIRSCDILLIDDVQNFASRFATQEEFFHTFNFLQLAKKQIILSCSAPPRELNDIEERLISRFEWGMLLPLPTPTNDLKRKLILQAPIELTENSIQYLLEQFTSMHILKKALQTLTYQSKLRGKKQLETELVISSLKHLVGIHDTPESFLEAFARERKTTVDALTKKSQDKREISLRNLAMYLLRKNLHLSYTKIGKIFSRDHSTVMAAVKDHEHKSKL